MATTYYSDHCKAFREAFAGIRNVTTFETEGTEYDERLGYNFDGAAYINNTEFVCVSEIEKGLYMVYINNPYGKEDKDGEQWVFGYYKHFKTALNKVVKIVTDGKYPKPIEVW